MYTSQFKSIIELAQSRGSTATTRAGARRYLLNQIAEKSKNDLEIHQRGRAVFLSEYLRGELRGSGAVATYWRNRWDARMLRRAEAACESSGCWPYDVACAVAAQTDANILSGIKYLIKEGHTYRVANSRWAGGKHSIEVEFAGSPQDISARGDSVREWSSNGKWSGNNSVHRYKITRRVPTELLVVGGLVTLDAEPVGPREYRAAWAEQGRGFDLNIIRGFIIRGFHVRGNNLARARKVAGTARAKTLTTRLAQRAQRNADRKLNTVWVSVDDSLRAGNCNSATQQFAAKVKAELGSVGELGAVRADVLLGLRSDHYARRAVAAAQQRR